MRQNLTWQLKIETAILSSTQLTYLAICTKIIIDISITSAQCLLCKECGTGAKTICCNSIQNEILHPRPALKPYSVVILVTVLYCFELFTLEGCHSTWRIKVNLRLRIFVSYIYPPQLYVVESPYILLLMMGCDDELLWRKTTISCMKWLEYCTDLFV